MSARIDLTGHIFHYLTVIRYGGNNKKGKATWECICKCGKNVVANGIDLRRGECKSCGCFKSENAKRLYTTHGMKHTPEFKAWSHIKQRCYNKNYCGYKNYGMKGIKMCDSWLNSFETFFADMGKRPSSKHSIDRFPDKAGNYDPDNCRWATMKQQQNNRTNNRIFEYKFETGTISQLVDKYGGSVNKIRLRVRRGWTIERALTT